MAVRTIEHPDVEISELDLSQYTPGLAMTTNLVMGFTERGEEVVPQIITSKNSFLNYYGAPKSDAERYAFAAAEEVFNQNGTLIFSRIPYNNSSTGKYYYLKGKLLDDAIINRDNFDSFGFEDGASGIYEMSEKLFDDGASIPSGNGAGFKRIAIDTTPRLITSDDFDDLRTMNSFPDAAKDAITNTGFVIVNKARDVLFGNEENAGLFVVVVPAYNALKSRADIGTGREGYYNHSIFNGIKAPQLSSEVSAWTAEPILDLSGNVEKYTYDDFVIPPISKFIDNKSQSRVFASAFPPIRKTGLTTDTFYTGQVAVLVCKSYFGEDYDKKLSIAVLESHVGSLDRRATDTRGRSIFIGDQVNSNSSYIEFYMELSTDTDYLVGQNDKAIYTVVDSLSDEDGASTITWPMLSFTAAQSEKDINYASLINSIDKILERVKNIDEYEIDLIVDAGISSIAQYAQNDRDEVGNSKYEPERWSNNQQISFAADLDAWRSVCSKLIEFCQFTRRDCFAILDAPRSLVLKGNSKVVRTTSTGNAEFIFDTEILPLMRLLTGLNTNYAAIYTNWLKILDQYTGKPIWLPETVKAVGAYNYVDRVLNVFEAPAGLNNAIINGINDLAFNPTGEQADQIYLMGFNYAKKWPFQGYTIEGQKTLQNKASAFDRINVRRMFLRIERLFRKAALYYLYRPNNFVTRVQLYDTLAPILEQMKAAGGIQEYLLVINEQNNTPEVIDRNELKIAVFIKPTKIAEFIRATFIATSQGVVLEELQEAILPQL